MVSMTAVRRVDRGCSTGLLQRMSHILLNTELLRCAGLLA